MVVSQLPKLMAWVRFPSPAPILLWFLGLLTALLLIVPLAFFFFFNANDIKPYLTAYITEKTALPIKINGTLQLEWFPWLGLKAHDVTVPDPAQDTPLLHIQQLSLKIPLHDLLKKQLKVESLALKGIHLSLVKYSNGNTNYERMLTQPNRSATTTTHTTSPSEAVHTASFVEKLNKVHLEDVSITYRDNAQDTTFSLSQGTVRLEPTHHKKNRSIEARFFMSQKGTPLKGKVQLYGHLHPEQLNLHEVQFTSPDLNAKGQLTLPFKSSLPIHFVCNVTELDLERVFKPSTPSQKRKVLRSQSASPPSAQSSAPSPIHTSTTRPIRGTLSIQNLIIQSLSFHNFKAETKIENGVVNLNPVSADFYEGKLNGRLTHYVSKAKTTFQGNLTHFSVTPVLTALHQHAFLSGTATLDLNVEQKKASPMQGIVHCKIENATLYNVDLEYFFAQAKALLKQQPPSHINNKQTTFQTISATLKLHDALIENNDLLMRSPKFTVTGEGNIALKQQTIAYKMQAKEILKTDKEDKNALPLAIRIHGPLAHPQIEPDLDVYLKKALEYKANQLLTKQLQKNLSSEGDATPEALLKEKVGKELEKKLKKWFKHHEDTQINAD